MIEVFITNAGTWRFRISDKSGVELAGSSAFATEADAEAALEKTIQVIKAGTRKEQLPAHL